MTNLKQKFTRRCRTTLSPSSAPQVVSDKPASLRDDTSPRSKDDTLHKIIKYLDDYESLTKVENLPPANPRVKHIRERIENAMPDLNRLSTNASSSSQVVRTRRHAEQVLSSYSKDERNNSRPPRKSAQIPPIPQQAAAQSARMQSLRHCSPRAYSTRPEGLRAIGSEQPATTSEPSETDETEPNLSSHQIAMLTAVHNAVNHSGGCRDNSRSWSDAPVAVSPDELSSGEARSDRQYQSASPSVPNHRLNPTLPPANVGMIQPSLPATQQPIHPLPYQSSGYPSLPPQKLATSSIQVLRGNGTCEPAD